MAKITIEELESGMVLACDLLGPTGRLLLRSGTTLEEKHLRVLKMWGVTEAEVQGISEEEVEASQESRLDPEALRLSREYHEQRFSQVDLEHEAVRELFRLSVHRTARILSAGGKDPRRFPPAAGDLPGRDAPAPRVRPEEVVRSDPQLASLPDIYVQINEALNNPRSSATHVGDIIAKDQSLSAKLLRLVNSAFYGFPSKIDTLSRAVTIVGSKQLVTLALGISVITVFKDIPPVLVNMRSFWKHSIACAMVAKVLAGHLRTLSEERFFVAGLLHDIGRLVIYKNLPLQAAAALGRSVEGGIPLLDAEHEIMGFNHARIGSLLMKNWKFPATLESMVRYHHQPERALSPQEPAVIHLADVIVQAMELGSSGNFRVPALIPEAWSTLGLSKGVLAPIITQIDHQVEEIVNSFVPDEEG